MDAYSRPALVKPHQDDLLREAANERLARAGSEDRPSTPAYLLLLFDVVARVAAAAAAGAGRVAAAASARAHPGHAHA